MKKLDSFLIKSFIGPFFAVLFIVIFTLSMQFLWTYIDELVGKGLGMGVIFEFMGWAACTLIPMAMPLATLLASIMTLGNLGERNELLAMKAAGISLMRIISPVMVLSAIISVSAFFAANNLVPVAYNKIYTLREDIAHTKDEIKIPTGTFYDGIEGYILRVGSRSDDGMMYDLMIYDHTSGNGNTNMTLADSGMIHVTPDKKELIFDLYQGCSYQEDNKFTYRDTTTQLSRVRFDKQQLIVPLENYNFARSEEDQFGDAVMARDLNGLKFDRDSLSRLLDTLLMAQHRRYFANARLNFISQIDTSYAGTPIVGSIDIDTLYSRLTIFDKMRAVTDASQNIDEAISQIENYERESFRYVDPLRRIDIEAFRKFTLSLACLLFFFIGAPLGAIIRKGGLGTPVIISIFFFLMYYIIDIIGKKLAKNGAVSPLAGTIVSTLVLIPIGIFLTNKSTHDSSLFNAETYKEFFKGVGKWISKRYHRFLNLFSKSGAKIRIVFMGTPEFAVESLDALCKSDFEVVGVVTVPDRPSGRGLTMNESAVKKYAVQHNLPLLQPEKLKDPEFLAQLAAWKANLFVVVAFRMLPREVWQMPALGTFNLHASLLPQYRGAAPINWAIINGEKFTGVTTFMIDDRIDTGKILFQHSTAIQDFDDAGTMHHRLMKIGALIVLKTVDAIENRNAKQYAQEVPLNKPLLPAPKITKETCRIDWNRSAASINLLIRGLSPYPAAFTSLEKDGTTTTMKIFEAYAVKSPDQSLPVGSVTSDGKSFLEIKCGQDSLRIFNLQLAGKKRMEVNDFLLGFRDPEKWKFI